MTQLYSVADIKSCAANYYCLLSNNLLSKVNTLLSLQKWISYTVSLILIDVQPIIIADKYV